MKARSGLAFTTSHGMPSLSNPVGIHNQAQSIQPLIPASVSVFTMADTSVSIWPSSVNCTDGMTTAHHRSHPSLSACSAAEQERACSSVDGHSNILPGSPRGQARSDVTHSCSSPSPLPQHQASATAHPDHRCNSKGTVRAAVPRTELRFSCSASCSFALE